MNQYAVDAFGPEESLNADNGICKASELADHIIGWQFCFVFITHLCHWDAVNGAMKMIYLLHRRLKLGVVYYIDYVTISQYRVVASKYSGDSIPTSHLPQSEANSVPFHTALLEAGSEQCLGLGFGHAWGSRHCLGSCNERANGVAIC